MGEAVGAARRCWVLHHACFSEATAALELLEQVVAAEHCQAPLQYNCCKYIVKSEVHLNSPETIARRAALEEFESMCGNCTASDALTARERLQLAMSAARQPGKSSHAQVEQCKLRRKCTVPKQVVETNTYMNEHTAAQSRPEMRSLHAQRDEDKPNCKGGPRHDR